MSHHEFQDGLAAANGKPPPHVQPGAQLVVLNPSTRLFAVCSMFPCLGGFIDVALDTAPYAGTTTTCEAGSYFCPLGLKSKSASGVIVHTEALYMGVPVVTLKGKGIHERSSAKQWPLWYGVTVIQFLDPKYCCYTWLFSNIQGAERWSFLAFSSSVGCTSLSLNLNQHCQHCFRKRSQLARSLRIWSPKLRRILSSRLPSLTDCAVSQGFVSAASFYCNAQAASCAKNLPRLAALRAGLRTRMLRLATRVLEDWGFQGRNLWSCVPWRSVLCDGPRHVARLERLYACAFFVCTFSFWSFNLFNGFEVFLAMRLGLFQFGPWHRSWTWIKYESTWRPEGM